MRSHYVCFPEPFRAALAEEEISPENLRSGEALVSGQYSVISPGTELSHFTNLEAELAEVRGENITAPPFPRRVGYGHLGEVVAVGPDCGELAPGDIVLTLSKHASPVVANVKRLALKIPPSIEPKRAVLTRMAGVAITALRSSSVAAGDQVVVLGLGTVGNLAAQLMQLAGADVLGVDLSPGRLEAAQRCGVRRVVNATGADLVNVVDEWTYGRGARITVEAVGHPALVAQAVELTGRHGEVIMLGGPRARVTMDVEPMLLRAFILAQRIIGALEWTYPIAETEHARFSIIENYRQILQWIGEERLVVDPLISHVLSPRECQRAYDGLLNDKDEYRSVLFDWHAIG